MQILCVSYIKRPFEKYHNTLSCPSKHCFQFLLGLKSGRCGRDEKRAANSGGGGVGGGGSNKVLTPIVLWLSIPLVYFFRPLQFGRSWLCFCRDTAVADLTE